MGDKMKDKVLQELDSLIDKYKNEKLGYLANSTKMKETNAKIRALVFAKKRINKL